MVRALGRARWSTGVLSICLVIERFEIACAQAVVHYMARVLLLL